MNFVNFIKKTYNYNDDLIIRKINNVSIIYFESLCDSLSIYEYIIKYIKDEKNTHIENEIKAPKITKCKNKGDMLFLLENGFALVIYKNTCLAVEAKANLDRGVTSSLTESSLYGPKDAFSENYQRNLGLLKRRIRTNLLTIKTVFCGKQTKNAVSLIYISNLVKNSYINDLLTKLSTLKDKEIIDGTIPFKLFNRDKLVSTIIKSEKPSVCASFLLKGYAIILIDNTPFQLILDVPLKEHINYQTHDNFVKILRILCFFITVLTPAFYIALINFNQESIPINLLISISSQRYNVPFPSVLESLLMLFVCEVLREADLRFPSAYGSAASTLGALIIGDAAVSAGIVSPIMIIIIALTYITSLIFTEIKLLSQIRIIRFLLFIAASTLGLFGLGIFVVVIINYLCKINMMERDYL